MKSVQQAAYLLLVLVLGAIVAKELVVTAGSGQFHVDDSLIGTGSAYDIRLSVRQMEQYRR